MRSKREMDLWQLGIRTEAAIEKGLPQFDLIFVAPFYQPSSPAQEPVSVHFLELILPMFREFRGL